MALKLVVESLRDEQPKTTVDKLMEGSRLTIGRTKDNDWALPFGSVSRKHCVVEYRNDEYSITDLNSLNGVYLNGQQLTVQTSHKLHDQDEIRIGGCHIRVFLNIPASSAPVSKAKPEVSDHTAIAQINPQDLPRPDAAIPEGATVKFSKQADERHGQKDKMIADADLSPPDPEAVASADETAPGSNRSSVRNDETPLTAAAADSGDKWNFLKDFEEPDSEAGPPPARFSDLDDLLPAGPGDRFSATDQDDDDFAGDPSSVAVSSGSERRPDDNVAIPDEEDLPADQNRLSDQAGLSSRTAAPSEEQPPSYAEPAAKPYRQPQAATDDSALLAAFLQGAGVPDLKVDDAQQMMHALGDTFRLIVAGMAESLQARRDTKRAIKADDMTQFGAIDNNPLKLPDMGVDSIIKLLLMSQGGAYLSMPEAIRQGFENLHSHQLGTMAGMRAALNSLLECFDPKQLEGDLSQRSFLESIMPAARKAKYWDAYLQHYDDIAEQAEENFLDLIGDDLREQLSKVTRSK